MLARTKANLFRYDEFIDTVMQLVDSHLESSDDYLFLARVLRWTGNFDKARECLNEHSKKFADRPSTSILERMIRLNVDANVAQRARDCDEASQLAFELDTIRQLAPSSASLRAETIANHVWAYRLLNRSDRQLEAQAHVEAVLRIAPSVSASGEDHRGTSQLASFYEDIGPIETARLLAKGQRNSEDAKSRHKIR